MGEFDKIIRKIPLTEIVPGSNPRDEMGDISGLAASIEERGLLQPIRVKKGTGGIFEILTGHRRYAAHRQLGRKTIEAIVVEAEKESDSAVDRLVENLQREDLRPLELAKGIDSLSRAFKKSDEDIARGLGKSPTVVKQWRLLSRLPDDILGRITTPASAMEGEATVSPRHLARVLSKLPAETDNDAKAVRLRNQTLGNIREFFEAVESHGGINAHQADAVWSMVARGESAVSEAVENVAQNPEAYRYGKRSFDDVLLPPSIESGAMLEEETARFFSTLASQVRSRLAQISPAIVSRLSLERRAGLINDWKQLVEMAESILHSLQSRDAPGTGRRMK